MKQLFIKELSSIDHGKDFNFTLDKSEEIAIMVDHCGNYEKPEYEIYLLYHDVNILLIGDLSQEDVEDKEICEAVYKMARQQIIIEMRRAYRQFNKSHTQVMDIIKEMNG